MQLSRLSVLICTYNRHTLLEQALTALIDRTIEKPDQVVVVNGGDERADRVVQAFAGRHGVDVKLVQTRNVNLATSRNIGLQHCDGSLIAMTDDDAEVFPDWVTKLKAIHEEHPEAGAVGGAIIGAQSSNSLLSRIADVATFPQPDKASYVRTLPGVNVCYKREVIDAIGPQDETLFRGEDVDFNWRVKLAGYEILYHPDICVKHWHRPTLKSLFQQHYMYGRAYYLVRRKWPEMYSVLPARLDRPRDVLKGFYFFLGILVEAVTHAARLQNWHDRMLGAVILTLSQVGWRGGMLYEMVATARNQNKGRRTNAGAPSTPCT